jgi:hypothetical protein
LEDLLDATEEVEAVHDDTCLLMADEPVSHVDAMKEEGWRVAMEEELASIEENITWEMTSLPPGHRAIGLKWVLKLKRDANGEVVMHKARPVAKGYVQRQGWTSRKCSLLSHEWRRCACCLHSPLTMDGQSITWT